MNVRQLSKWVFGGYSYNMCFVSNILYYKLLYLTEYQLFIAVGAHLACVPIALKRRIIFHPVGLPDRWGRTQGAPLQWIRI